MIGKSQHPLIAQCHCKAQRRQPLANKLVYAREQRQQVFSAVGSLGNREKRRLARLCLFAFGDVTGHGNTHFMGFGPACRPLDMHHMAVLVNIAVLEVELGFTRHNIVGRQQGSLTVGREHQINHGRADQFPGFIAEDTLARRTDINEAAIAVHHTYSVQQQVDKTCL